mmetsp:Transcript_28770/g.84877  ORF Transcript_28770/g.84877 Transcript_28770/m.84877 type:complete len:472 (+) Transcript_28770:753-2168(+)
MTVHNKVYIALLLSGQEGGEQHREGERRRLGDGARPGLGDEQVSGDHVLGHLRDKAEGMDSHLAGIHVFNCRRRFRLFVRDGDKLLFHRMIHGMALFLLGHCGHGILPRLPVDTPVLTVVFVHRQRLLRGALNGNFAARQARAAAVGQGSGDGVLQCSCAQYSPEAVGHAALDAPHAAHRGHAGSGRGAPRHAVLPHLAKVEGQVADELGPSLLDAAVGIQDSVPVPVGEVVLEPFVAAAHDQDLGVDAPADEFHVEVINNVRERADALPSSHAQYGLAVSEGQRQVPPHLSLTLPPRVRGTVAQLSCLDRKGVPDGQADLGHFLVRDLPPLPGQVRARVARDVHPVDLVGEPQAVGAPQVRHHGVHGDVPSRLLFDLLARQSRDVAHEGMDRHHHVRVVVQQSLPRGALAHDPQMDIGHHLERAAVRHAVHQLPLGRVGGEVGVPRHQGGVRLDAVLGHHVEEFVGRPGV